MHSCPLPAAPRLGPTLPPPSSSKVSTPSEEARRGDRSAYRTGQRHPDFSNRPAASVSSRNLPKAASSLTHSTICRSLCGSTAATAANFTRTPPRPHSSTQTPVSSRFAKNTGVSIPISTSASRISSSFHCPFIIRPGLQCSDVGRAQYLFNATP